MNNDERNTHFQGFAKLLWDEIEDKIIVTDTSMARHYHPLAAEVSKKIELLIAQRAYDLSLHVLHSVYAAWDTLEHNTTTLHEHVPDLTEWPKYRKNP